MKNERARIRTGKTRTTQAPIAQDRPPRDGWKEAFAAAGPSAGEPLRFEKMPPNEFDKNEWTW
jgi:hypothetical protein